MNPSSNTVVIEQPEIAALPASSDHTSTLKALTIVIPCFNEAEGIHHTCARLRAARDQYADDLELHFVFVDDASRDDTCELINAAILADDAFTLVRHPENRGITGAIMTGIQHARTEWVCSLDADCTYDPARIGDLVRLLSPQVSMVTASPYHPRGTVENVPGWRLWISRGCSFLYRRLLKTKLYTYTSCFRIYRRSELLPWQPKATGFVGLVEMIAYLEKRTGQIVECPATLSVRQFGQSKMRILRVIVQHLGMMSQILKDRMFSR